MSLDERGTVICSAEVFRVVALLVEHYEQISRLKKN